MTLQAAARDCDDKLWHLLRDSFQQAVELVSTPGGADRKTTIFRIGSQQMAVSVRGSEARARLEAEILSRLGPRGFVPRLVRRIGPVVVQEHVEGVRLPVALYRVPETRDHLRTGIAALIDAQIAGARIGLAELVPLIGERTGWDRDLAQAPFRLGERLGQAAPHYDFGDALTAGRRGFIKWDARPGNAIVRPDGSVCWIDWEHAGNRRFVDDLAWLIADEWAPVSSNAVAFGLEAMSSAHGIDNEELRRQFLAMAVVHSCMRILLILDRKGDDPWWNYDACLREDRVGVTAEHVRNVAERAAIWSNELVGLRELVSWFQLVAEPDVLCNAMGAA